MDDAFDWDAHHAQCEERRNQDIDKFRVVLIDNLNRESVSDIYHSAHPSRDEAFVECEKLRENHKDGDRWPTVYQPGKKLYVFEP